MQIAPPLVGKGKAVANVPVQMRFSHPCNLHIGSVFTVAGLFAPLPWWRRWLAAIGVKQGRRLQVFEVREISHGGRRIVTEKIGAMPGEVGR
jgi:hypothetical protein